MVEKKKSGCVVPSAVVEEQGIPKENLKSVSEKEARGMSIMVGRKAPNFTAPAYYNGNFTTVSLSDFVGKWVLLCFYPGDFTFV